MNAPRYAFYIMIDEPKPRADVGPFATAGVVAAPAGRRIVERTAPILGLVPEAAERIPPIQQSIALPLAGRGPVQQARPANQPAGQPANQPAGQPPQQPRPAATAAPRPAPSASPSPPLPAGFEPGGPLRRTTLPLVGDARLTDLLHRPLHLPPSEPGRAPPG